jgi:ABC-type microcin C transport system duplicated ATPase subunit YejF
MFSAELQVIVNQELLQPLRAIQPRRPVAVLLVAHILSMLNRPK